MVAAACGVVYTQPSAAVDTGDLQRYCETRDIVGKQTPYWITITTHYNMEAKIDRLTELVTKLTTSVEDLTADVKSIREDIDGVKGNIQDLNSKVENIEETIEER